MFSFSSFNVSGVTFKALIHLSQICTHESNFILHMDMHISFHHW